ncbi:unnamed protein product, partial [Mesorhabditis belari]|uniref:Mitochondrial carrier protein n=1 Tax=Mesorhabditis belari TaxID=2138241 RepID=A0AAF3ESB7_9BILA
MHNGGSKNQKKTGSALVAGAIAGATAKTVIAPLERSKIYFQVSSTEKYSIRAVLHFIADTYRTHGFTTLFKGHSAQLARVIPFSAIQFASHEKYSQWLRVDVDSHTPWRRLLSGALTGLTASFCTYPLDSARAILAISDPQHKHTLAWVFVDAYKNGKLRSLYRGVIPTLLGMAPYGGIAFFTFDSLTLIHKEQTGRQMSNLENFACGAVAGVTSQAATYPLDIVRRRMQTGRLPSDCGIVDALRMIIKNEGFMNGWYKGFSMNLFKSPLTSGISFMTYQTLLAKFVNRST